MVRSQRRRRQGLCGQTPARWGCPQSGRGQEGTVPDVSSSAPNRTRRRSSCATRAWGAPACKRHSVTKGGRNSARRFTRTGAVDRRRHQHSGPRSSARFRVARPRPGVIPRLGGRTRGVDDSVAVHPRVPGHRHPPANPHASFHGRASGRPGRSVDVESPAPIVLGESNDHWPTLHRQTEVERVQGPMVHDPRIAAIRNGSGVREILTADRDFGRFPPLASRSQPSRDRRRFVIEDASQLSMTPANRGQEPSDATGRRSLPRRKLGEALDARAERGKLCGRDHGHGTSIVPGYSQCASVLASMTPPTTPPRSRFPHSRPLRAPETSSVW